MPPFWMLNARDLVRVIFQLVVLSLGVPFDSLQPSACFRIQDGGRNSGTQDYVVLAAHKIRLSINPNIIVNGFLMIRNLSCVSCSSVLLTVRA